MADSFITVAPDSTGKSMQTYLNTIAGTPVHAEAVVLVDSAGNPVTSLNVAATQSGTWNIGTISSNVPVTDAGGSLTVDGTIAATQSGDWTVKSNNAANFLSTITGTVTATQSNASNLAVTASQGGTWNIGTITGPLTVNAGTNFNLGGSGMANGQINVSTTPATLVAARATRRSVSIRHIGTTTNMYFGTPVISSGNGMLLRFGDSISVDYVGAIQIVSSANGTNNNVAYLETFD